MKKAIIFWNKFSKWVDRNLGYYLTNPHNHWRLKERFEKEDSLINR
jgi:hypothetical protein